MEGIVFEFHNSKERILCFKELMLKQENSHEDWEHGKLNNIFKIMYKEGGKMRSSIIYSGTT